MFELRKISLHRMQKWQDWDFKIYQIQAAGKEVEWGTYEKGVEALISQLVNRDAMVASSRVGYIIFHEGSSMHYLVACAWGNDNELFVEVRVFIDGEWRKSEEYSFCLYDMEVMWFERNAYVSSLYSGNPDREQYLKTSHTVTV